MCRIHLYVRNSLDFSSQVLYGIYARGAICAVDIQYCSFVAHTSNVRIEVRNGNCGYLQAGTTDSCTEEEPPCSINIYKGLLSRVESAARAVRRTLAPARAKPIARSSPMVWPRTQLAA
jgi:hypothetical protein